MEIAHRHSDHASPSASRTITDSTCRHFDYHHHRHTRSCVWAGAFRFPAAFVLHSGANCTRFLLARASGSASSSPACVHLSWRELFMTPQLPAFSASLLGDPSRRRGAWLGCVGANLPSVVWSAEKWEQAIRDAQPAVDAEGATSPAPASDAPSEAPTHSPLASALQSPDQPNTCTRWPWGATSCDSPFATGSNALQCGAPPTWPQGFGGPLGGLTDNAERDAARAARQRSYSAGYRHGYDRACRDIFVAATSDIEPERVERRTLWCGVCLTHHVPRPCELVTSPSSTSSSSPSSGPTHLTPSE